MYIIRIGSMKKRNAAIVSFLSLALLYAGSACVCLAANFQSQAQPGAIAKSIGKIKAINGNAITLTPASGSEMAVTVQPNARILRLSPGDKDLKNATPVPLPELQVGDMIRVRGNGSEDGKSIAALEVIVITASTVAAVSDQVRQDWQKRGVAGIVQSVDPASGTVTLSVPRLGGKKEIAVHTSKNTVIRRYAPDSAKPENAKPSSLQEIHPSDQLRARGDRNADGSEVNAEEIYAGVFPQFSGTIKSVDANAGTLTVQDLVSKKTVEVKVTPESQLHKIPPEMAQGFATRLKSMMAQGIAGMPANPAGKEATSQPGNGHSAQGPVAKSGMGPAGGMGGGMRARGGDLQQMVSLLPTSSLADLHLQKGDAVVILSTEGSPSSSRTAVTLLSGVEPILQAAPNASQAMMLTPWSLGGAPGGEAAQ